MTQKIIGSILLTLLIVSQQSCSKIDNYAQPNATLTGEVIDTVTGAPIQTNVYDCMIELDDLSWSQNPLPFRFTTRPDGTFTDNKVFAGKYKVTPVNGPFIPIDTKVTFEVEPYLNVKITDLTKEGKAATVSFKITSKSNLYQVTDSRMFVNNTVFVGDGNSIPQFDQDMDLSSTANDEIYSNTYQFKVDGLISGRTYYMRVGARSNDPGSREYNYSEIKKVVIP
jgi:hypothetical protein